MKTVEQIRRLNLLALIQEAGSVQGAADQMDRSYAVVSQWKNGTPRSGSGRPAVIEADSARDIERKFNKPVGWMDHDHELWPLTGELMEVLKKIGEEEIRRIENSIRAQIDMPQLAPASPSRKRRANGS